MASRRTGSTPEPPAWGEGWRVGLRVWVERAGRAVLGKGRLELLEGIDRCRSISGAARQMGMSYRHAWLLVQSINEASGEPLVETETGGAHGGGACLTPLGRWVVAVFRGLQDHLDRTTATLLPQLLRRGESASLHVAAAVSLEEVVGQLLTDYALCQPTVRVCSVFGASDELAEHVLAGAPADLFLTADPRQLDRLEAARLVEPGTRRVLAENGLAAIGPAEGAPVLRKPAQLARAERVALAEPGCPLGRYSRLYLEGRGLYDAVAAKAVRADNSRAVVAAVRGGQADVGLVYSSDAIRAEGCRLLFRVSRLPQPIRYEAAVVRGTAPPEPARDLLVFLTSKEAGHRFRRCGFLPRGRRAP